jgi:hypothetical protein
LDFFEGVEHFLISPIILNMLLFNKNCYKDKNFTNRKMLQREKMFKKEKMAQMKNCSSQPIFNVGSNNFASARNKITVKKFGNLSSRSLQ